MSYNNPGIKEQKKRILGYDLTYIETRVNGYPEVWQAIQRAVEEPDRKYSKYHRKYRSYYFAIL